MASINLLIFAGRFSLLRPPHHDSSRERQDTYLHTGVGILVCFPSEPTDSNSNEEYILRDGPASRWRYSLSTRIITWQAFLLRTARRCCHPCCCYSFAQRFAQHKGQTLGLSSGNYEGNRTNFRPLNSEACFIRCACKQFYRQLRLCR